MTHIPRYRTRQQGCDPVRPRRHVRLGRRPLTADRPSAALRLLRPGQGRRRLAAGHVPRLLRARVRVPAKRVRDVPRPCQLLVPDVPRVGPGPVFQGVSGRHTQGEAWERHGDV